MRLIGAARGVHAKLGVQPAGPIATRVASIQDRLRQLLGNEAFERELAAGSLLTLAEARLDALALAREGSAHRVPAQAERSAQLFGGLTGRELDVLRLITEGKTDRQIAEALFITPENRQSPRHAHSGQARMPQPHRRNRPGVSIGPRRAHLTASNARHQAGTANRPSRIPMPRW